MKIGHFVPSYRPICDGLAAQIPREEFNVANRLGFDYMFWAERTADIVQLRNRAIQEAIRREMDFLLMQDSDVWSKSSIGAITPLLQTALQTKAAMVGAIVGLRRDPPCPNVVPCKPGEVYEADKVGTGLVLIDVRQAREVEATQPSPVDDLATPTSSALFGKVYSGDGTEVLLGEDIWFCKRLRGAGKRIVVDGRLPTTHAQTDVKTLDYPGAPTEGSEPLTETHTEIRDA